MIQSARDTELCVLLAIENCRSTCHHIERLLLLRLRSSAISLRFTILSEIFEYVTVFNPTIEVVREASDLVMGSRINATSASDTGQYICQFLSMN